MKDSVKPGARPGGQFMNVKIAYLKPKLRKIRKADLVGKQCAQRAISNFDILE